MNVGRELRARREASAAIAPCHPSSIGRGHPALDRATGRLIDWECGGRDQMTFERLLARLRRWKVRLVCTDEYVV